MSLTNAFETSTLKYLLNTDSVTRPTAWYIGLFTSDPTDTGIAGTEVSGNAYVRAAATFSVTGNTASNTAGIEFPAAAGGDWGTVGWIGIIDALTSGNMIIHSSLVTAKIIADGDVFRIPTGDLDVTLD
mgnify:CR=1 FL=1